MFSYLKTGDFINDVLISGRQIDRPDHVVANDTYVFWGGYDFTLQRATLGDNAIGSVTTLSNEVSRSENSDLVLDGTTLYTRAAEGIVKVGVNGGPLTTVAAAPAYGGNIAVSDAYVYWRQD